MITNADRLFHGVGTGQPARHPLRILKHMILEPIAEQFDITITSAWRDTATQQSLTDSKGNPIDPSRKAKGLSQHELGEAVDFVPTDPVVLPVVWEWCLEVLYPWQAILELDEPRCIHLSIPSVSEAIKSKRLMHYRRAWHFWKGDYPDGFIL